MAVNPSVPQKGVTDFWTYPAVVPVDISAAYPNDAQKVTANALGVYILGSISGGTTSQIVTGNVASGVADSGNPVKVGARVRTGNAPTLTNGWRTDLITNLSGELEVFLFGAAVNRADGISANNLTGISQTGFDPAGSTLKPLAVATWLFNGLGHDQQRANIDVSALVTHTAAAAGTTNSADQVNYNGRGVQVGINLTTVTTATVTVTIQGKDPSGTYYDILTTTALATAGFTNMTVYPGAATTANASSPQPLPRTWRIKSVIVGASAAVTGTINASVIV